MKSLSAAVLAVVFLSPGIVLAQQQAPEPELQRPSMPSMEGQQGPVVSATAVSPPSKKKHDAGAVEPFIKPQPAKKPAPETKSPPAKQPQKGASKPKVATKMPAKQSAAPKASVPKKGARAGPAKAKKK